MVRIDRENTGSLNREFLSMLKELETARIKNPGKKVVFPEDFVPQISVLYKALYDNRRDENIFYISPKTVKRIDNMDVTPFLENRLATNIAFKDDDCGHLVWEHQDKNYGTCDAAYCIKDKQLYAKVYTGGYIAGYIVHNEDEGLNILLCPYSSFTMLAMQSMPDKSRWPEVKMQIGWMHEDFHDQIPPDLYKVTKRKDFEKLKTHDMIEDYLIFRDILLTALQAIIFMKTAEVYSKEYIPDSTPTFKRHKNYKPLNYTLIDTTWDMDIDVNNPFPVRGHFKMQPYKKEGEWDRKLIYIESYMKSGYHRKATKTRVYGASE